MSCTYIAICTEEYLNYYRQLYSSLKEYSPNSKQILYYIGNKDVTNEFDEAVDITEWMYKCNSKYDRLTSICSLRARVVLNAFNNGHNKVIFCGAKLKFFSQPRELQRLLHDGYQAVVTPHITEPLPEDGKFPSNEQVSFTGHISTDLVGFNNTPDIVKFLTWQDEIMKTKCQTSNKTYLDQSWLNFLPFFVDEIKIFKDHAYNVAYWNYKQRKLEKSNGTWFVRNPGFYDKMVCFQFSGLNLENPAGVSTHQNREVAEGDFLEFLKDYAEKVK